MTTACFRRSRRRFALAAAMTAGVLINPGSSSITTAAPIESLDAPQRLVDSRQNAATVDGQQTGIGPIRAGATLRVNVAGRAGIDPNAKSVVLNITAVNPESDGFFTVFPCTTPPNASNLNYIAGNTIANAVVASLDASGDTCIFSNSTSMVLVDVAAELPGDSFIPLPEPARFLDTRLRGSTVDGAGAGAGPVAAEGIVTVPVRGRSGVPADATAVVINLTAVGAASGGFLTAFPCGATPNASNLNYLSGRGVANMAVVRLDSAGRPCVFSSASTNIIVDVAGSLSATDYQSLDQPQRVLDTRLQSTTADLDYDKIGTRNDGESTTLLLADRVGLPANARAVVINITAVRTQAGGFITVHPQGTNRPTASNLNFLPGLVSANTVVAPVGLDGTVCLYNSNATGLIVDVVGYFTGPATATQTKRCPNNEPLSPASARPQPGFIYTVNDDVAPGRWVIETGSSNCIMARFDERVTQDSEEIGISFGHDNSRLIFDIRPTDIDALVAGSCNTPAPYIPPSSPSTSGTIGWGHSVVGLDFQPGLYTATVGVNCYAEAAESFDGSIGAIFANLYIEDASEAGMITITVPPWATAFYASPECGTWTSTNTTLTTGGETLAMGDGRTPEEIADDAIAFRSDRD